MRASRKIVARIVWTSTAVLAVLAVVLVWSNSQGGEMACSDPLWTKIDEGAGEFTRTKAPEFSVEDNACKRQAATKLIPESLSATINANNMVTTDLSDSGDRSGSLSCQFESSVNAAGDVEGSPRAKVSVRINDGVDKSIVHDSLCGADVDENAVKVSVPEGDLVDSDSCGVAYDSKTPHSAIVWMSGATEDEIYIGIKVVVEDVPSCAFNMKSVTQRTEEIFNEALTNIYK